MSDPTEPFDLYDPGEFRAVGRATRGECHGNPALVHAAARVQVFDRRGRILLQLRAAAKDVQPGKWDTAVGGHLLPGEDPEAAARREMAEELGVAPRSLRFLHRFLWRTEVETEWVTTYAALHEGPFRPDPAEVADLRFWTREEIVAATGSGQLTPAIEDEMARLGSRDLFAASHDDVERNLGEQPIARLMAERGLKTGDLAEASQEHVTRKMVTRACKGRRLTPHVQAKILRAFNRAAGTAFALSDLFTYSTPGEPTP